MQRHLPHLTGSGRVYCNEFDNKKWILIGALAESLLQESRADKNLSFRCPPRPKPSIPDHHTGQGMPWEHAEGLSTLRWWPESVFPGFPEMHHFGPGNRPTHTVLSGQYFNPPFFALMGMVWPYLGTTNWWNSDQNPHFYNHATFLASFLAGKWQKSSPPSHTWPQTHSSLCLKIFLWQSRVNFEPPAQNDPPTPQPPFLTPHTIKRVPICSEIKQLSACTILMSICLITEGF